MTAGIRRAPFITFEGPEGGGKTTQMARLGAALRARGLSVLVTREPGGTPAGEKVRQILLDPGGGDLLPDTEALLFCAARLELVTTVVRPALASGTVVLCDRFADATVAYQGYGGGADRDWLADLNRRVTGGLVPDLTVLLDLPPDTGLHRRRGLEWTRLDAADLAFHCRVREGYLTLARAEPQRWAVVNADQPMEVVAADIEAAVGAVLATVASRPVTHGSDLHA